jgi:hypothetical protein
MRTALLAFVLLVLSAHAADTPLSAILIDGEGWWPVKEAIEFKKGETAYVSKKVGKGPWALYKDGGRVVEAAEGEVFGETAISPGGGRLVLAVSSHHYLYAFQLDKEGRPSAGEKCYVLRKERPGKGGSGVGNMVFDGKGRLFVAMPGGVQYFDEEMRFSGQIAPPSREPVTFVTLWGDRLVVECGGAYWKRKIRAAAPNPR